MFDRAAHCRRIAGSGGAATVAKHGHHWMRAIGKADYAATAKAHGRHRAAAIVAGKGWQPRQPDLLSDLAAGRELARLAA